jgi:hypothetical protein
MSSRIPLLLAILVVACSSSSVGSSGDGGNDATTDDARHDSDGGACPDTFEAFKSCTTAADCISAETPTCCGQPRCVGIARASASDFSRCNPAPDCHGLGCASSSECVAEDGHTTERSGRGALGVACTAGRCSSFVLADAGAD